MAGNKKLGIDVQINYPSAAEMAKEIQTKWKQANVELEIDLKASNLNEITKDIKNKLGKTDFEIGLKTDTKQASKELDNLRSDIKKLKNDLENALTAKMSGKDVTKNNTFDSMKDSAKEVGKAIERNNELSKEQIAYVDKIKGAYGKVVDTIKQGEDGMEKTSTTVSETYRNFEKLSMSLDSQGNISIKTTRDQVSALKDIVKVQKEINSTESKSDGSNAYNKRIETLKVQLKDLKEDYKQVFNSDANDSSIMKNVESIGKMNMALKESAELNERTKDGHKDAVSLLNEQFSIEKKIQSLNEDSGGNEKAILEGQLSVIKEQYDETLKKYNLVQNSTAGQLQTLNLMIQENDYQKSLTRAKQEDLEIANRQKSVYSDLKSDLKEMQNIQSKITGLQAKSDSGAISAKEQDQLNSLKQQLDIRERIQSTTRDQAREENLLTSEADDTLSSLERQYNAKEDLRRSTAEINADISKTNQLYDEVYNSIKKIDSLNQKLASAGDNEATVIQDAISKEERKADAIRETIQAQGRVNNAREEEIDLIQKSQTEQNQLNADISKSKKADTYNSNSTIGMLDPMTVINEAKQIGMAMYESVALIDTQYTNIAKVANASDEEMAGFMDGIFDTASEVGKSADLYAEGVERWVTAGFDLQESVALAKESTMGAFVGNIDESAMVDYMSVPLVAFKDTALESSDVLNTMNEVANQNAIEMDDLGAAYKKSAGTAATAGTSFGELTGMITAAQESTRQGGDVIGTALKAIDINFSKMSAKLTDSDIEKFDFFSSLGVDIQDSNGQLRSTYDIIGDLSGKWEGLNSEQQSTALFYAGGKNHAATLQGIATNWDVVTKATGEANSQMSLIDKTSGSAYQEFAKQQDSVEYAVAGLKNAWAEFINEVSGGRGGVVMMVDTLKEIVDIGVSLSKNEGFMKFAGIMLKAGIWMTANVAAQKLFNTLGSGLTSSFTGFKNSVKGIKDLKGSFTDVGGGATGMFGKIALGGKIGGKVIGSIVPIIGMVSTALMIADGVAGLFGTSLSELANKGIDAVKVGMGGAKESLEDYTESTEKYQKKIAQNPIFNGELKQLDEAITKYEELIKAKEEAAEAESKETGEPVKAELSVNEFEDFQKSFNETGKDFGIEIKINDIDHINQQLDLLAEKKKELGATSSEDLAKNFNKMNKGFKSEEQYTKNKNDVQDSGLGIYDLTDGGKDEDYRAVLKKFEYGTEEFEKLSNERLEKIAAFNKFKEQAMASVEYIDFSGMDKDEVDGIATALLGSTKNINTQKAAWEELSGVVEKGGDLTQEQALKLVEFFPEISAWGLETSNKNWEAGIEGLNKHGQEIVSQSDAHTAKIKEALAEANFSEDEINEILAQAGGSNAEYIKLMAERGDAGALALGVSEEALAYYGESWDEQMLKMQESIESLPDEKVTKYSLLTDDGLVNWDMITSIIELPEEVITEWNLIDDEGNVKLDRVTEMLDGIGEEKLTKLGILVDGELDVAKLKEELEGMSEEEIIKFFADTTDLDKDLEKVDKETKEEKKVTVTVDGDKTPWNEKSEEAKEEARILGTKYSVIKIKADKTGFDGDKTQTEADLAKLNQRTGTPYINANRSGFTSTLDTVNADLAKERGTTAQFKGEKTLTYTNILSDLSRGFTTTVKFNGSNNTGGAPKKGGSGSVGISSVNPNIGRSFSQSVTSDAGINSPVRSTSNATSANGTKYTNRDDETPATVDSDVWRYWAKELFKGIPLERSMDDLSIAIGNASEDYNKLISLYKQQISLLDKQIAYETDMKNAKQSEMGSVLSELRKLGFKTSGNQVTNLGITKNMKGDKAEKSTELLTQWKDLYSALDAATGTINSLKQDKVDAKNSIVDAEEARLEEAIEKELEKIEKTLTKTEALLTKVQNDTALFSNKLGFISDSDFELQLSVTEEGVNKSSANIKSLTDEFNRLSKTTINYADNADTVKSQLETLKSEILDNADAIIEYRDALNQIELDRFTSDFENFTNVMDRNLSNLENNIENLKEGLVSGTDLGDLASSAFYGVDFTRKTKMEQEYEQRLKLEAELNEALEAFAKKNVDRAKNVANATLTIETDKYKALMKIASDFSNGKVSNVSVSSPDVAIGKTTADITKDKTYSDWTNTLKGINNDYTKAYASMVDKYDKAMKNAKTASEKEKITNSMIIEQLKLQEGIYNSMISANNKAISQAQTMLKDTSLSTEQRQALLDSIKSYQEANVDAQNSVKNAITSRYDLEFDLMDEAISKAQGYSEELGTLLDIAEAVGSGSEAMNGMYKAIYEGKINEYATATQLLKQLTDSQSGFAEGSYEWNILKGKIEEIQSGLGNMTLEILNANKDVLSSELDKIQEASEKLALNGKTLDEFESYTDSWMDGIEKELELEKLRIKLSDLEDKSLQGKLELMDRQEKVSRAELDYIDKQLSVIELQEKLNNINNEKTVQTLAKDVEGNWQWQYVADQTEYDSTKSDLDDAKLELEKYKKEQQSAYVSAMNDILSKAKNGEYDSETKLAEAINDVTDSFDGILEDIAMELYNTEGILAAYKDYQSKNKDIVSSVTDGNNNSSYNNTLKDISVKFGESFLSISNELGSIIGDELRKALELTNSKMNGQNITIEKQILEFPNVIDSSGLEEAFKTLPQVAKQISLNK